MSKHTPGPWHVSDGWVQTDTSAVCMISRHALDERELADARLIAAAPDLLEALELILETRIQEKHMWSASPGESPLHDRCLAAIAKAKGEQA